MNEALLWAFSAVGVAFSLAAGTIVAAALIGLSGNLLWRRLRSVYGLVEVQRALIARRKAAAAQESGDA